VLSIGLMSGTSMDGIDAALLETDGSAHYLHELGHTSISYPPVFQLLLKAAELAVRQQAGDIEKAKQYYVSAVKHYLIDELDIAEHQMSDKLAELSTYLHGMLTLDAVIQHSTELHILAVKKLLAEKGYAANQIDVIGYHGQTLFHSPPRKVSIIVGDGQYLAEQTNITVVNNFRRCDIDAGGQGAPFAPIYHQALAIRDKKIPLAVINCGGISNVTLINSACETDLVGFDTGPGNNLIDRLVRQRTRGKENMDRDGQYGKQGQINTTVLQALYEKSIIKNGQNYFLLMPPKVLDAGDITLIPELDLLSLEDACATLEMFTADSIIRSVELLNITLPTNWILTGGGWNNSMIREEFIRRLTEKIGNSVRVMTADNAGWNSQAMEAQIFAFLAVRSLRNMPLSVPSTTRVPRPLSGGQTYIPTYGVTNAVKKLLGTRFLDKEK